MTRKREEVVVWALDCPAAAAIGAQPAASHGGDAGRRVGEAGRRGGHGGCVWMELDVPCKVGSVDRAPCFTAPFHRRLAWQFWFLAFGGPVSRLACKRTRLAAVGAPRTEMWHIAH